MKMTKRDVFRSLFGLVVLQPLTYAWCLLTGVPYFDNLGIFSIVCTIYLIPMYGMYERWWDPEL